MGFGAGVNWLVTARYVVLDDTSGERRRWSPWASAALRRRPRRRHRKSRRARAASSAGVERVFSAAGKMHGDLQKSAKDSTLEHSLFAAYNTD